MRHKAVASITPAAASTILDSFNRADSATVLGNTDTGQTWVLAVGAWGISSNLAYSTHGTDGAMAVVDLGATDCTVQAVFHTSNGSNVTGIMGRYTDVNNHYLGQAFAGGGSSQIYKRVGGTYTQIGSSGAGIADGDTVSLIISGTSLTLKKNGVTTLVSTTDSALSSGTWVGIRKGGTASAARWNDFQATTP